ncbi:hypothetical protein C1752_10974 [Acaryochloris thomasi RCC1774]|uniref:Tc1-like transposase DDE domain-containing protein n=2 Tax=Acaryochloris TaxID=155977 RepID=A0A2W1JFU9_9CYAN|nr:hypothetical protein C1752_10974 [Acaryochloris thomasi RCC1774]
MEEILAVYERPYDLRNPLICLDEATKQLVKEITIPIAARRGQPERVDYEYERNGTANLFMLCEPIVGARYVKVTQRRTALDYAHLLKELVDVFYPEARQITLVQDNLNIHSPSSLYKAFAPQEARRILSRLEFVYTPKHGSWLNMAEIELSILARQCLDQRIADFQNLQKQVSAWNSHRNQKGTWINWRFTTQEARVKLQRLYPAINY